MTAVASMLHVLASAHETLSLEMLTTSASTELTQFYGPYMQLDPSICTFYKDGIFANLSREQKFMGDTYKFTKYVDFNHSSLTTEQKNEFADMSAYQAFNYFWKMNRDYNASKNGGPAYTGIDPNVYFVDITDQNGEKAQVWFNFCRFVNGLDSTSTRDANGKPTFTPEMQAIFKTQ